MVADPKPNALIAGQFAVDLGRPLTVGAGGTLAYAVQDRQTGRTDLMAVSSRRQRPPRAHPLAALTGVTIPNLLTPIAHGPAPGIGGEEAYYVVSPAAPGPPIGAAMRPWAEGEVLDFVLRPLAVALEQLSARRVTHRAIRLDNVFRAGGEHAVLGAAWSAPPAILQPAVFEPPYVAACLPAGRGEGTIADDVYALGVLVLSLTLGRVPMAGMDDASVIRRKLDLGSYDALVGDERLAPAIADLVRGMVAEDPDHRPTPLLLTDPPAARARRVAARPPRRAQRGLEVSGVAVWDARALAYAMSGDTEQAVRLLRSNAVDGWLRRGLGDTGLASRLDEVMRLRSGDGGPEDTRADALLAARSIAVLDPLAPLCWRGLALWPDGIGAALAEVNPAPSVKPGARPVAAAAASPSQAEATGDAAGNTTVSGRIEEIVHGEVVASWAAMRPERCDGALLRLDVRQSRSWLRAEEPGGGLWRMIYGLNPLLACASPLLQGRCVARLVDLLPALEAVAGKVDRGAIAPVDRQIASFIAARFDQRVEGEMSVLGDERQNTGWPLVHLRLLARLQQRLHPPPLPATAAWMAEQAAGTLNIWRNRKMRARLQTRLAEIAEAGQLGPMLSLLEDPGARAVDARGAAQATQAVARIDGELAGIADGAGKRTEQARRIGQEIAAGLGLAALAVVLALAALS